jgi:hypothetical protein
MNDDISNILDGLTRQIMVRQRAVEWENRSPGHSADASDGKIKDLRLQIAALRAIRVQLEELFASPT